MENSKTIVLELRMTRNRILALLSFFFLAWHPAFIESETLTLTTYYPAPYGGYTSLLTTGQTILARDTSGVGLGGPIVAANVGNNNQPVKLDMRDTGAFAMDNGGTIYSRGVMHIDGEGILYLLNQSGVEVGTDWGGNGNLTVDGDLSLAGKLLNQCTTVSYRPGVSSRCPANHGVVGHRGDGVARVGGFLRADNTGEAGATAGAGTYIVIGEDWGGTMVCCKFL